MNKNMVSKEKLTKIRLEMDQALDQVAKNNNIESIKIGTIRFDENGFKTSIEANFEGGESVELRTLKMSAAIYGFKPEIAGAKINFGNKEYTVTGVKRTKMTLENGGKTYLAPIDKIVQTLRNQKSLLVLDNDLNFEQPPKFKP